MKSKKNNNRFKKIGYIVSSCFLLFVSGLMLFIMLIGFSLGESPNYFSSFAVRFYVFQLLLITTATLLLVKAIKPKLSDTTLAASIILTAAAFVIMVL